MTDTLVLLVDDDDDTMLVRCPSTGSAERLGAAAVYTDGGVSAYLVPTQAQPMTSTLVSALNRGWDLTQVREWLEAIPHNGYTAGWSMPGCLPETAPEWFPTFTEALAYIVETVERFWDQDQHTPDVDADARWLDLHTDLHVAGSTLPDVGAWEFSEQTSDGHLTFWIAPAEQHLLDTEEGERAVERLADERGINRIHGYIDPITYLLDNGLTPAEIIEAARWSFPYDTTD